MPILAKICNSGQCSCIILGKSNNNCQNIICPGRIFIKDFSTDLLNTCHLKSDISFLFYKNGISNLAYYSVSKYSSHSFILSLKLSLKVGSFLLTLGLSFSRWMCLSNVLNSHTIFTILPFIICKVLFIPKRYVISGSLFAAGSRYYWLRWSLING